MIAHLSGAVIGNEVAQTFVGYTPLHFIVHLIPALLNVRLAGFISGLARGALKVEISIPLPRSSP
jgi:hypothetical protein